MVAVDLAGATQWLLVGTVSDCICNRAAQIASAREVAFEATTKAVPIWLPRRRWPILGETGIPVAVLPKLSAAAKAVAVG